MSETNFDYDALIHAETLAEIEARKIDIANYEQQLIGKPHTEIAYHKLFISKAKQALAELEKTIKA